MFTSSPKSWKITNQNCKFWGFIHIQNVLKKFQTLSHIYLQRSQVVTKASSYYILMKAIHLLTQANSTKGINHQLMCWGETQMLTFNIAP